MSLDFIPTGVATGASGSIMGTGVTTTIAAAAAYVVPVGTYLAYGVGATTRLQVQDASGWQHLWAVGIGGFVPSDGVNLRFLNAGGGNETVTLIKIG